MHQVCFYAFDRPIYWYGVMIAAAFAASVAHLSILGSREGRSFAFVSDLAFWVMLAGIGGARVAYVLANLDYFRKAPGLMLRIDQ
ncbi:MAG: prolipoprotein diacylglyceryl transferase, partial [Lentisphaerae bacterium]|nr:prolipoprotein diacylglyceryl transferase [Lentisphaerota bacterium]